MFTLKLVYIMTCKVFLVQVVGIMKINVQKVIDRGEKLDNLDQRASV